MTHKSITLVGDGIENPWNARTMMDAAAMFDSACLFRDRCGLATAWTETVSAEPALPVISHAELARGFSPIVAFDNLDGAHDVYGLQVGRGPAPAIVVGNERRGLAGDIPPIADHAAQIPMVSRKLNCLNVAAAAAVALYYLSRGGGAKLQARSQPQKRRPELLLMGATDHVELGSAIRSAGAFGWSRLLVEDRRGVWFGCDRATISEGRAAARRARNPIRVIPTAQRPRYAFAKASIITIKQDGVPLHRADLARGPSQLIVIPDEGAIDVGREAWADFARDIEYIHLSLPGQAFAYHYRLIATIALAEMARQVGKQAPRGLGRPPRRAPIYDRALEIQSAVHGETVYLDELEGY